MASGRGGVVFGGTTQKCTACEKTVYPVDELTVDNRVFHRACFRCRHCRGTLKLSNYSSFEGALYCKPHFDQLFKMTGSLEKSFEGVPRAAKAERSSNNGGHSNSRASSIFVGTQEKCFICKKTVYPIEKVAVDGNSYHRTCFRCVHGGCVISPSNYVAHEGRVYCKHHFSQIFMQKGDFSQFDKNGPHYLHMQRLRLVVRNSHNFLNFWLALPFPSRSNMLVPLPMRLHQLRSRDAGYSDLWRSVLLVRRCDCLSILSSPCPHAFAPTQLQPLLLEGLQESHSH